MKPFTYALSCSLLQLSPHTLSDIQFKILARMIDLQQWIFASRSAVYVGAVKVKNCNSGKAPFWHIHPPSTVNRQKHNTILLQVILKVVQQA